jgi:carbamoyl-phosphate synthase large subunit
MRGKRVMVTGGAGVIGIELVPQLIALGADVLVGDLKPEPMSFKGAVTYRQGDLNTLSKMELLSFDPEVIIHLAATFERSTESRGFWDENYRHNVSLSHHLMSLAQECKALRRVVFASSYLIYDQDLYQFDCPQKRARKLSESDPVYPRNLVGMAKLAHEQELKFLSGFSDLDFTTLSVRIFRGYGRNSRDVISRWVRQLIKGERLLVYRPEGLFDYIYAADSAEGLLRLASCEEATGVVNLGTGSSRRVEDVVQLLNSYFPDAVIENVSSDIPFEASEASTELLEKLTGWKPSRTIESAIPEIIEFERSRLSSSRAEVEGCGHIGTVLVTSASRKVPLINALKIAASGLSPAASIVAGDMNPLAIAQFEADGFWLMPPLDDEIVSELVRECKERGIRTILPTRDGELEFWAKNHSRFRDEQILVIISPVDSIKRCRDKFEFSEFGRKCDLPIIPSSFSPNPRLPCSWVVKERFGSGARGIGLNLSIEDAIRHSQTLEQPIFQPFVPGQEVSVDAWVNKEGKVVGAVLRRRDLVISGESQITTTFRDKVLEADAIKVLNALNLRGPVVLQGIITESGLKVIECNPRFGGASTASISVGLNSLYWSLVDRNEGDCPIEFHRSEREIRQVRLVMDRVLYGDRF